MAENKVESVDVRAEQQSAGWVVIANVEGEDKIIGAPHPGQEEADKYATAMDSSTDRWTGAAQKVDPDPEKYAGDGE